MYRGGTWLSPLHRMVPLPRSFAADAHGCIMVVGLDGPTEYKVVARWIRARGIAPLGLSVSDVDPAVRRVDWGCSASRRALARVRLAAYGLDPSAFPVSVARHGFGTQRRSSPKEERERAENVTA